MPARMLPAADDLIQPLNADSVTIIVDGAPVVGIAGQSVAGVILADGALALRRTPGRDRARGVFCGIGVCFDCLVEVNGAADVRACQRRAADGDVVITSRDSLTKDSKPGLDAESPRADGIRTTGPEAT